MTQEEKTKKKILDFFSLEEMQKVTKMLEDVIVEPVTNPRETLSSKNKPKLTTGTILDEILGHGGITAGKLIEMFGEYGTGKTQICFTLAAEAGQKGTIIYIDTEYTFSPERVEEILKARNLDVEKFWKNFVLVQPRDWMQQMAYVQQIPSPVDLAQEGKEPISLIVMDSLLALLDISEDFEGRQNLPIRSRMIRTHLLAKMRQLALTHNCAIVFTNQIMDIPNANPFMPLWTRQTGKGGPTVRHVPDIILYLRKSASNTRIARLMDSSELEIGERVYIINEKGIDDVPDEIKKKIEKRTKKETEEELKEEPAESKEGE